MSISLFVFIFFHNNFVFVAQYMRARQYQFFRIAFIIYLLVPTAILLVQVVGCSSSILLTYFDLIDVEYSLIMIDLELDFYLGGGLDSIYFK